MQYLDNIFLELAEKVVQFDQLPRLERLEKMGVKEEDRRRWLAITFLRKIQPLQKQECWNWKGGIDKDGYPDLRSSPITRKAHRISFILFRGELSDEELVCHTCDNPKCVNPNHLFTGDERKNFFDGVNKRRLVKSGRRRGLEKTVLNEQIVIDARKMHAAKNSYAYIARKFNISHQTIRAAVLGITWRHIV